MFPCISRCVALPHAKSSQCWLPIVMRNALLERLINLILQWMPVTGNYVIRIIHSFDHWQQCKLNKRSEYKVLRAFYKQNHHDGAFVFLVWKKTRILVVCLVEVFLFFFLPLVLDPCLNFSLNLMLMRSEGCEINWKVEVLWSFILFCFSRSFTPQRVLSLWIHQHEKTPLDYEENGSNAFLKT